MNRAWVALYAATLLLAVDLWRPLTPAYDPGADEAGVAGPASSAGPSSDATPDGPTDSWSRARSLVRAGRPEEALTAFAAVVAERPDDASLRIERALVFRQLERYDDAHDDLDHALTVLPGDPTAQFYRGSVRYHLGLYDEAYADFTMGVERTPPSPSSYFNRALVLAALHRMSEARSDLQAFLNLSQDEGWNEEARRILEEWEAMTP